VLREAGIGRPEAGRARAAGAGRAAQPLDAVVALETRDRAHEVGCLAASPRQATAPLRSSAVRAALASGVEIAAARRDRDDRHSTAKPVALPPALAGSGQNAPASPDEARSGGPESSRRHARRASSAEVTEKCQREPGAERDRREKLIR
jgi:hypothetical protein